MALILFLTKTQNHRPLKEIIEGNELFKKQNESSIVAFKQAQQNQSPETKQLVAEVKSEV